MEASGLDGHLGEGTVVKGTLRFEGSIRIDGKFTGKIVSPASLILGPSAQVHAEVDVAQLAVHGALKGSVQAADRVTIHASGKVEADVKTETFVIEPGALFQGSCDMQRPAPPATASPEAAKGGAGNEAQAPPKTPEAATRESAKTP